MHQQQINFNRQTRLKWLQLLPLVTRRPLKPLLFALESFLGENANCWPSVARLAQYVGTSERTTQRALAELEQLGLITRTARRSAEGQQQTCLYAINWSLICDLSSQNGGVTLPAGGVTNLRRGGDKLAEGGCQTDTRTYHKNQPKKHHGRNGGDFESGQGRKGGPVESRKPTTGSAVFGQPLQIAAGDLDSADVVESLYRAAVASGAIADNPAARLRFFALARYCRRNPALKNPGAVLATNVERGLWFGSDDDEARARRALARLDARREAAAAVAPAAVRTLFAIPGDVLACVSD